MVLHFVQTKDDLTLINEGELIIGRRPSLLSAQTADLQFH
jgi:hypothetical protein